MHLNSGFKTKIKPQPREDSLQKPPNEVGLFSSRSPHRPNPVALSALQVVSVNITGMIVMRMMLVMMMLIINFGFDDDDVNDDASVVNDDDDDIDDGYDIDDLSDIYDVINHLFMFAVLLYRWICSCKWIRSDRGYSNHRYKAIHTCIRFISRR